MLDHAIVYLESKGLRYADPAYYIPSDKHKYSGIIVESVNNGISISVSQNPLNLTDVPQLVLDSSQEHILEPMLDVLVFAITNGINL